MNIMSDTFLNTYRGMLEGVLSDTQYKALCESVNGDWYAIDFFSEERLLKKFTGEELKKHMYSLLETVQKRNMVSVNYPYTYAKDLKNPILIKVYDPMKCGSSCSTSAPDPWWIFTKIKPEDNELEEILPQKKGKGLFSFLKS